jgi:hypothetical protein
MDFTDVTEIGLVACESHAWKPLVIHAAPPSLVAYLGEDCA